MLNYKKYVFLTKWLWQDNLSAVDILSACNLVNYFGKTVLGGSGVGQIAVYPILIKKVCFWMLQHQNRMALRKIFFSFSIKWKNNLDNPMSYSVLSCIVGFNSCSSVWSGEH